MNKAFDKIFERLDEYEYNDLIEHNSEQCEHCKSIDCEIGTDCTICVMEKAKEIVREVAEEYKDGWIPCSEKRLPDEAQKHYLVTYRQVFFGRFYYFTDITYLSTLSNGNKSWEIEEADKSKKVVAWKLRPEPYKPKGE